MRFVFAVFALALLALGLAAGDEVETAAPSQSEKPGQNPCTRGPAFWCATLDNADLCNAFEYCKEHVWNENTTSPAWTFSKEFDAFAVSEQSILSIAERSITKAFSDVGDDCDCEVCEYLVNLFDSYVKRNSTQNLIEQYYDKLCLNVPEPMQAQCIHTVGKHFMLLVAAFGKLDPPKVCKILCSDTVPRVARDLSPPVNTCLCQVCQQAVKDIDLELMKSSVQEASVNDFVRYCGYLTPASAASKCEEEAKKYIPELYSMLSHMDPLRTCNRFAFCNNHSKGPPAQEPTPPPVVAATTKRHIPCLSPDFVVFLAEGQLESEAVFQPEEDSCACESCKYYVGQFNTCLQRNSTQSVINTFYHKLCQNLPPPMQAECNNVVSQHFESLIHDIAHLDPVKACKRDCQPQLTGGVGDAKLSNSCLCRECQAVIKEYAERMAMQEYQQEAIQYFTEICRYMPNDEGIQKCVTTAKDYLPELMNMLSHVDPGRTCSHFKYCQKKL